MAEDPINQQQFEEDVAAAAAAGAGNDGEPFPDMAGMGSGFKMPSVDEVWKMIQQMEGISEEEKENLRESLFNPEGATTEDFLKRYAGHAAMGHSKTEYMTFFAMIAIIFLVFALFGYKLYKSLIEKEQKKQEKLKNKQSKKSKKSN